MKNSIQTCVLLCLSLSAPCFALTPEDDGFETGRTLLRWNSDAKPTGGPPGMDEPLASDRPDFTEASCTVGRGVVQIETGYTYFRDGDGVQSHSLPETLIRVGALTDWLELRAAWNFAGEVLTTGGGPNEQRFGAEDLYMGLKLGLTPQQGNWPEMALVPQMTVPTGGYFSAGRTLPGVNWLYGWDICDFLSTAGSTQINVALDGGTGDEYLEFAQSWTVGYTLSEKLGAYTEWFMLSPCGAESMLTEHYFDGGLTYRVTNNLQLDVRAGKGISENSLDYFIGAGAVVRF